MRSALWVRYGVVGKSWPESLPFNRRQLGRTSAGVGPRRPGLKSQLCHRRCGWPWAGNFRPDPYAACRSCELNEALGGHWMDKGGTAASRHPGTKSSPWLLGCLGTRHSSSFPNTAEVPASSESTESAFCIQERAEAEPMSCERGHPGNPMLFTLSLFAYLSKGHGQSDLLRYLLKIPGRYRLKWAVIRATKQL